MNAPAIISTGVKSGVVRLIHPLSVNDAYSNVSARERARNPRLKGRRRTERYRTWAQAAASFARGYDDGKASHIPEFKGPVRLHYHVPERRKNGDPVGMDLGNAEKADTDLLVTLGALIDDGPKYVRSIYLDWVDQETGWVEITSLDGCP